MVLIYWLSEHHSLNVVGCTAKQKGREASAGGMGCSVASQGGMEGVLSLLVLILHL